MSEKVQQTETGNALQRFLKRKNIISVSYTHLTLPTT